MRILLLIFVALFGLRTLAQEDYFPLQVGNVWTMPTTVVTSDGKVADGFVYRKVESVVQKQGIMYYRLHVWSEGLPNNWDFTELTRKDEKAVYSINERVPNATEQIEYVLPLKMGSSWNWKDELTTMTDTVLGLEDVDISGKVYRNCFHIRRLSLDGSITEDYWQAPLVGDLKSVNVLGDGSKITVTLKEFKPGK